MPRLQSIAPEHNAQMAAVIRSVMTSFGACGPGYAIEDPEVDAMHAAYQGPGRIYLVYLDGERVIGGGGIAPLRGETTGEVAELQKMYFLPECRGRGLATAMLERLLGQARELGYRRCYLETLERMHAARALYERFAFKPLPGPLGETGHFGCDRQYILELSSPSSAPG